MNPWLDKIKKARAYISGAYVNLLCKNEIDVLHYTTSKALALSLEWEFYASVNVQELIVYSKDGKSILRQQVNRLFDKKQKIIISTNFLTINVGGKLFKLEELLSHDFDQ
jgi:hypothetical protein